MKCRLLGIHSHSIPELIATVYLNTTLDLLIASHGWGRKGFMGPSLPTELLAMDGFWRRGVSLTSDVYPFVSLPDSIWYSRYIRVL